MAPLPCLYTVVVAADDAAALLPALQDAGLSVIAQPIDESEVAITAFDLGEAVLLKMLFHSPDREKRS